MFYILKEKEFIDTFSDLGDAKERMMTLVMDFIDKNIDEERDNLKIVSTYQEGADWINKNNDYYCVLEREMEICVFVDDSIQFYIEIIEKN